MGSGFFLIIPLIRPVIATERKKVNFITEIVTKPHIANKQNSYKFDNISC